MAGVRYSPCLALIRASYASLTEAERRVADFVLTHPGHVLSFSIAEVAQRSGVGLATVTRLSTKLGYRSFSDMKIGLAVEQLSPNHAAPEPIRDQDEPSVVLKKVIDFGIQNLRDTAALINPDMLTRAANAVAHAERVECYATGGLSGPIAHMMQHRLLILGISCGTVTEPQQQVMSAELLRSHAVALGLSHSGESVYVASALSVARKSGAVTICVTSAPHSSVARAADICLLTGTQEVTLWSDQVTSRLPMLSVLDALYAAVALIKHRHRPPADSDVSGASDPLSTPSSASE